MTACSGPSRGHEEDASAAPSGGSSRRSGSRSSAPGTSAAASRSCRVHRGPQPRQTARSRPSVPPPSPIARRSSYHLTSGVHNRAECCGRGARRASPTSAGPSRRDVRPTHPGGRRMRLIQTLLAATATSLLMAGAGQAKTLVYCSEGSPEGFDPAPWTAGTTFDAASRTDLRPADRVQEGLDRDRARPRRELGGLRGRHRDHLPPAPGREVPDHGLVHADPRDERRRRRLHLHAPVRQGPAPGTSTPRASPGSTSTRRWRPR